MWPVAFFTLHNVFKVHSRCSMYQFSTSFYLWPNNTPLYGCTHILFTSSFIDEQLSFHFFSTMNNAAINSHVQVFVWTCVFSSLGYISSGITGVYDIYLITSGTTRLL